MFDNIYRLLNYILMTNLTAMWSYKHSLYANCSQMRYCFVNSRIYSTMLGLIEDVSCSRIRLTQNTYINHSVSHPLNANKQCGWWNCYRCAGAYWSRHQMETFPALLAICAGNSPVSGEFPTQRPVPRSFAVFFELRQKKLLSKLS